MRKVLLRIVFDHLWRVESIGNELLLGYGWLLAAWIVFAAISLGVMWKMTRDSKQLLSSLVFWCAVPAVLALIPIMGLPIAQTGIPVFGYGFMLFVGFSTATYLASKRARAVGLDPDVIWDLMMWLLIPGIIGARIVYLTQNWSSVVKGAQGIEILKRVVALWDGGIVFYGCIIGGVVGLLIFCRRRNIRPLQLGDVLMPSLFVGLGFGRIGCFLYGCCFGAACSLPWAVEFPSDSLTFERLGERSKMMVDADKPDEAMLLQANGKPIDFYKLADQEKDAVLTTIPLHPTQIYSSVLAFSLGILLMWYFQRRPFEGAVLALGWILYPVNRFVLEIIRDDEPGRLNTSLTFSQLMSIGLFLSGIVLMIYLQKSAKTGNKKADTPAT